LLTEGIVHVTGDPAALIFLDSYDTLEKSDPFLLGAP